MDISSLVLAPARFGHIASLEAILIGTVGRYGAVSLVVSLRGRELAVRIAVGAEPSALPYA